MNSNGILTLAELDKQMKELVALFQKQAALNYKEKAFYDDAVVMKRLRAKLHNDDKKGWMLCLMLPNDYKEKSGEMKSFPPSVICIAASDLKELLAVLQGLLLEILTNGQDQILPRIANHVHGGETNSKKEEFWSPGIISSLGSGSIMLRPWRAGSTNFVKLLSPRPPSPEYEWLGVQMTLYLEEAMSLCSHLQEFMKELLMNGVSV